MVPAVSLSEIFKSNVGRRAFSDRHYRIDHAQCVVLDKQSRFKGWVSLHTCNNEASA